MNKIGQSIKAARKHLGLTQGELGERIGIGKSSISEWESGKRLPDLEALVALTQALSESGTTLTVSITRDPEEALEAMRAECERSMKEIPRKAGRDAWYFTHDGEIHAAMSLGVITEERANQMHTLWRAQRQAIEAEWEQKPSIAEKLKVIEDIEKRNAARIREWKGTD